jgi:hypothetical protein
MLRFFSKKKIGHYEMVNMFGQKLGGSLYRMCMERIDMRYRRGGMKGETSWLVRDIIYHVKKEKASAKSIWGQHRDLIIEKLS